jgi:hypothetical protein
MRREPGCVHPEREAIGRWAARCVLLLIATAGGVLAVGCLPKLVLTARESAVTVGKTAPASTARELGAVQSEDGTGCGILGKSGSYERAEAKLRDETAAMGGDYVKIVKVLPAIQTLDCLSNRWAIEGIAYRTGSAVTPPPAPAVMDCTPPCSPGYACSAGTCLALCNPACGPDQICRQDRTCAAAR